MVDEDEPWAGGVEGEEEVGEEDFEADSSGGESVRLGRIRERLCRVKEASRRGILMQNICGDERETISMKLKLSSTCG